MNENNRFYLFSILIFIIFIVNFSAEASIIQSTKIQRVGKDIELSWDYDPKFPIDRVDIWLLSGEKIEFDKNPKRYSKVNTVKGNYYKDIFTRVGDNQNCYYRIVPAGSAQSDIFNQDLNDRTVAKFDIKLKKGLNLLALPLLPQIGLRVEDLLGGQLNLGDQVVYFDNKEKDFRRAIFIRDLWEYSRPFNIMPGQGFFIQVKNETVVTFVGEIIEEVKAVIYDGNNLIGNSSAQTKEINKSIVDQVLFGTQSNPGDAIYSFNPPAKALCVYDSFVFSNEFLFTPAAGFWYQRRTPGQNVYQLVPESSGATFSILPPNAIKDGLTPLEVGCVVQFITSGAPPNNVGTHLSKGQLMLNGKIGGGNPVPTGTPGTFNYFLGEGSGEIYLRIWNARDISGSVRGKRYFTAGPFLLPNKPSAPAVFELTPASLKYVCAPPAAPDLRVEEFSLKPKLLSFTVVPFFIDEPRAEVASNPKKYWYKFRTKGSKDWQKNYLRDGPLTVVGDPFFKPGKEYEVVAAANNYFGTSGWNRRKIASFTIPYWIE